MPNISKWVSVIMEVIKIAWGKVASMSSTHLLTDLLDKWRQQHH